ncbi:BamA/TamA family outer membrane protein [Kaarinaea lacus]
MISANPFAKNMACILAFIAITAASNSTQAASIIRDISEEEITPQSLVLPYFFSSESLGLSYGVGGGVSGYLQDQMSLMGAALFSTKGAKAVFFIGNQIQIPKTQRLFLDVRFSVGRYPDQRGYFNGNPEYAHERAGSNESSDDNYVLANATDDWLDFDFEYVLPIGAGRDNTIQLYRLDKGVLVQGATGGNAWNPLRSGLTMLSIMPFIRSQGFETDTGDRIFESSGIKFGMEYDNTDFPNNPSRGSKQDFDLRRDFGGGQVEDAWTQIEFSASKFFPMGKGKYSRQRVLGLNFWTSDVPTWKETQIEGGSKPTNAPPFYMGSTLGGLYRLRAYTSARFHDKSAIYYSAEYRYMLRWNAIGNIKMLQIFNIDWWQLMGFAELGRVAPGWDIQELHSDMKWDVGIGLRAMISKAVLRLDVAANDEIWSVWVMAGQAF